ncbi:hypothetical protein ACFL24_00835 [Patescibacteria group bacterium]
MRKLLFIGAVIFSILYMIISISCVDVGFEDDPYIESTYHLRYSRGSGSDYTPLYYEPNSSRSYPEKVWIIHSWIRTEEGYYKPMVISTEIFEKIEVNTIENGICYYYRTPPLLPGELTPSSFLILKNNGAYELYEEFPWYVEGMLALNEGKGINQPFYLDYRADEYYLVEYNDYRLPENALIGKGYFGQSQEFIINSIESAQVLVDDIIIYFEHQIENKRYHIQTYYELGPHRSIYYHSFYVPEKFIRDFVEEDTGNIISDPTEYQIKKISIHESKATVIVKGHPRTVRRVRSCWPRNFDTKGDNY